MFLQTRFTPVFGSNGPLWSLFNEFWYYVLFPALGLSTSVYSPQSITGDGGVSSVGGLHGLDARSRALGVRSYTLYVVHFPLLFFIRATLLPSGRWQPDTRHLAYGSFILVFPLLYAFAVARMTESKTPVVREWVRNRIAGAKVAALDA